MRGHPTKVPTLKKIKARSSLMPHVERVKEVSLDTPKVTHYYQLWQTLTEIRCNSIVLRQG